MSLHKTSASQSDHEGRDSPLILITTSRSPTASIRTLSNNLSWLLPNSLRLTRGKSGLKEIAGTAIQQGCSRVIILERWKTGMCKILFYSISPQGLKLLSPGIHIKSFLANPARRKKHSRIPAVHSIRLLSRDKSARRLAVFLSRFLELQLVNSHDLQDMAESALTVSVTEKGQVKISIEANQSSEGMPSLHVDRVVWDIAGA